jgi:hypothetical protein
MLWWRRLPAARSRPLGNTGQDPESCDHFPVLRGSPLFRKLNAKRSGSQTSSWIVPSKRVNSACGWASSFCLKIPSPSKGGRQPTYWSSAMLTIGLQPCSLGIPLVVKLQGLRCSHSPDYHWVQKAEGHGEWIWCTHLPLARVRTQGVWATKASAAYPQLLKKTPCGWPGFGAWDRHLKQLTRRGGSQPTLGRFGLQAVSSASGHRLRAGPHCQGRGAFQETQV